MIKKTIGIAAILLLLLGIAIGIARANTTTVKLQKHDRYALASKVDQGLDLRLNELKVLTHSENLVQKDLATVEDAVKQDVQLSAKLKDVALVKLHGDLSSLVLGKLSPTNSWNKYDVVNV